MIETIQQAVKTHDKYQIEVKLDYELLEGKETRYRISTYFFVPQSLGITAENYPKSHFYRDVQNYIRLKTPVLNLRDYSQNSRSPLAHIEQIVNTENWANDPVLKARLINSFKLLSAMVKSSMREHFNLIEKRIAESPAGSKVHWLIHNLVEAFLLGTAEIAAEYRTFFATFNLPNVDEELFTAYKLMDEYISMLIEEGAVEMFQIVGEYLKKGDRDDFLQQLNDRVKAESRHRRAHGYHSILRAGNGNEEYVFRASVLKKYAASVLYLSTAVSREGRGLEQILFALAAGLSMIFATFFAFYFQYRYGNFTFPFFVALVVGYMFKDRIKEIGRELFAARLQDRLYDRRIDISTQDGRHKLGVLKEKVAFVNEQDVPRPVIRARNKDLFVDLDNDGQGENIICYTKDIVLYANAFKKVLDDVPEITGLNDIIRYDIRAFLRKMAEPVQERPYLHDGQLHTVACHKVYHVNLISRYRALRPQKEKLHRRLRIVLNQEGIKRIEDVSV